MPPTLRSPKAHPYEQQRSNAGDGQATHRKMWKYLPDGKWCDLRGVRGDGLSGLEDVLEEVEHACASRGGQHLFRGRLLHKPLSLFTWSCRKRICLSF